MAMLSKLLYIIVAVHGRGTSSTLYRYCWYCTAAPCTSCYNNMKSYNCMKDKNSGNIK